MKIRIGLLLVVTALFAVPSFAQRYYLDDQINPNDGAWSDSASYEQGQYMDNPCTSIQDWVWVNYSAYAQAAQKAAGTDDYLVDESTTMGGMYKASGSSQSDVGYARAFTTRYYHKVDTPDAFHVVTVITVDPTSKYTTLAVETACGNGMPDSKE
jgi:hypothetical protein